MTTLRKNTIAIVGQGYVGLPLAMSAAKAGWNVIGIDQSSEKVEKINSGHSPIEDISSFDLKNALTKKQYFASCEFKLISRASIVIFCVPTPLNFQKDPDLLPLQDAVKKSSEYLLNDTLLINESTSYPGTLRNFIIPIVKSSCKDIFDSLYFASSPERVNPGDKNWNQSNTPRLIGGIDNESTKRANSLYKTFCNSIILVSSPEVAEAAKLFENTFRLVNIGLVNEFAQICGAGNLDVNEVLNAAATKPFGFLDFRPSVGVGGHCIPIDPMYLSWWARQNGAVASLIEKSSQINQMMPEFIAEKALKILNPLKPSIKILVVGVAYKAGLSDTRETPVQQLIEHLEKRGVEVRWHDPLVAHWKNSNSSELTWECDLVILAVNQPDIESKKIFEKGVPILDCTNSLRHEKNVYYI